MTAFNEAIYLTRDLHWINRDVVYLSPAIWDVNTASTDQNLSISQLKNKVTFTLSPEVGNISGDYELNVMDSGDLTVDWNTPAHTSETISMPPPPGKKTYEFTGPSPILQDENSIIGYGVKLQSKTPGVELVLKGVLGLESSDSNKASTTKPSTYATCVLQPLPSAPFKVKGVVFFQQQGLAHMKVVAKVEGLNHPGSLSGLSHGIHIHTFGDLSDGGGTSVGGHFNPLPSREHRLPGGDLAGHVGDLGNIAFYDHDGVAWYEQRDLHKQDLNSTTMVLGRAVVIHSKMDDGCTQPTGGAGGKLAWCVIGMVKGNTYSIPMPPFEVPQQKGSSGCTLNNTPDAIPKSASFIWMVVIISVALAAIGLLFGYNWWKARQNPAATTTANGRQPWYQQQNEDEDDGPTS